ncbi:IL-6 subfamily cytokine M17 [Hippocampus zosterae]|uniref:IL-6 subfamily cytokine M17 n=1 Tax=Hippocampus zosterae TaxID=109293 RepID=UPI00223CE2EC|nr:IL-6 subfamily cytokine M17 [Hippocampus zosterae]
MRFASTLKKHKLAGVQHEETQGTLARPPRQNSRVTKVTLVATWKRMIGRPLWTQWMSTPTTLLALLLLLLSTNWVSSMRTRQCPESLQRLLRLTRLAQKESTDLVKTYKASQGEMSDVFCRASLQDIPEPGISGLEPSERMESILDHLQEFLPHLRRIYEQQKDLQAPDSPVLVQLGHVSQRGRDLGALVRAFFWNTFPNLQEPAEGPTVLEPPPQNIFQQKVYGCVVVKTYKEFLSNVAREFRSLKGKVCRGRRRLRSM